MNESDMQFISPSITDRFDTIKTIRNSDKHSFWVTNSLPSSIFRIVYITVHTAWLNYLGLFTWLSPSKYFASKILWPFEQIVFFTLLGIYTSQQQDADFYVVGNAVHVIALSGIFGVSMAIGGERWAGTLSYLFGTPASRLTLFGGRTLFHMMDGLVSVIIGFALGILIFELDISQVNPLALILVLSIIAFSTSAMGLLVGSISLVTINVMFFNNSVYILMLLASGVNIPVQDLPIPLQGISFLLPLTRGLAAVRQLIDGDTIADVFPLIQGEIVIGLVYFFAGYLIFTRLERKARSGSILDAF